MPDDQQRNVELLQELLDKEAKHQQQLAEEAEQQIPVEHPLMRAIRRKHEPEKPSLGQLLSQLQRR